jgi:hypothetical protein
MRVRTTASISIIIIAIIAVTAASSAVPAVNVVKDPEQRFTIAVPWNWKVQTSTSVRAPAVAASSPAAPGQLPDSVDVITQDLPTAITPQDCADKAAQVMRFTIHRWGTVHEGTATLAGLPAYSRSYNWRTSGGQDRRSVQTCVTLGRRAFVIVATTANTPGRVQQELPKLEEIMATFRPNTSALPSELPTTPRGGGK